MTKPPPWECLVEPLAEFIQARDDFWWPDSHYPGEDEDYEHEARKFLRTHWKPTPIKRRVKK